MDLGNAAYAESQHLMHLSGCVRTVPISVCALFVVVELRDKAVRQLPLQQHAEAAALPFAKRQHEQRRRRRPVLQYPVLLGWHHGAGPLPSVVAVVLQESEGQTDGLQNGSMHKGEGDREQTSIHTASICSGCMPSRCSTFMMSSSVLGEGKKVDMRRDA